MQSERQLLFAVLVDELAGGLSQIGEFLVHLLLANLRFVVHWNANSILKFGRFLRFFRSS